MAFSEQDIQTLNALPLVDVMSAWGYTPSAISKTGTWSLFLCPWHDDHHPSLVVDMSPRGTNPDSGFMCRACKEGGFGAIQLAARLMGKPAGVLSTADFNDVVSELVERLDVKLEGSEPKSGNHTSMPAWDQFRADNPQYADWKGEQVICEYADWTPEALRALGFRVSLAQQRAKRGDIDALGDSAEVRIGDMITKFDPDTGEALYRCSIGKDYYQNPNKAEARTVAEWGRELEEKFHVRPVSRFIFKHDAKQGGNHPVIVSATGIYPVFVFQYAFGIKKYEPRSRESHYKWTWWDKTEDADLEHRYYSDTALEDALEGAIPQQDERHKFITIKDKDKNAEKIRFERVVLCSGPRDAMQVWAHSNAHVVWLNSETAGFDKKGGTLRPNRWLRSLLKRLRDVTVEGGLYVCYDEDAVGLSASQAIALAAPYVRLLRLPKELGKVLAEKPQGAGEGRVKPLKDVTDFVKHFSQVEALMPADLQHDDPVDWFDNAMTGAPTCQFWLWQSERKTEDGTGRPRYKFDLRNVPVFLRARGMVRKLVQQGKSSFSRFFLLGNDNTYTECFSGEKGNNRLVLKARELMYEWLMSNTQFNDGKGSLAGAIRDAKLDQSTLEYIEDVELDDHSFGEDFDHFFFENTAVCVTKDSINAVPYTSMKWWTNRDAILDGKFSVIPQHWRIILNPQYPIELQRHIDLLATLHTPEERAQENVRWNDWSSLWKFRLIMDKPLDEMPMHFRFFYNLCRIFWEKEEVSGKLPAAERQMQDMYFIAVAHGLGSALVRHRTSARQQWVHITDNGTPGEDLASGGTGKTIILNLLALMRRVLCIDGKSLEGGNITLSQELNKVIPGLISLILIDELPAGFSPKSLYNYTLSITSRGLYHESMMLTGDDLPKIVLASNETMDLSSESTLRRMYELLVGNYYHSRSIDGARPERTPADDFQKEFHVKEVARNLPQPLLNEARNLMIAFTQFFLQWPDETVRPPKDNRAMLRQALAASKDRQFTQWAAEYIGNHRHQGIPISYRELQVSLLDYCGIAIGAKTLTAAQSRIRKHLPEYIKMSSYVMNPDAVMSTPTAKEVGYYQCKAWQYQFDKNGNILTDEDGNRLPRVLANSRVFYFYRHGHIPNNPIDQSGAHDGDPDYVQRAPDIDPDA